MTPQSLQLRLVGGRNDADRPLDTIDPIAVFEVDHLLKVELCHVLEALADGLPHEANKSQAEIAVTVLRNVLPDHIALEEQHLFPLLMRRNEGDPRCNQLLEQLKHEHDSDEAFGYEIAEELEWLIGDGTARNAEMLGYMLRGFFVAIRRHVKWENATVLPLARQTLSEPDLNELRQAIIERSRRPAGIQSADFGDANR